MASPEHGYIPEVKDGDPETSLQESYARLGQERADDSASLLPQGNETNPDGLTEGQEVNAAEVTTLIEQGIDADLRAKLKDTEIINKVVETLKGDVLLRAQAAEQQYQAKLEAQGKKPWRRAMAAYRNSRTARIATAAVLGGGAIALAATGATEVALVAKGISMVLRAASTYLSTRDLADRGGRAMKFRGERKLGGITLDKGGIEIWEGDDAALKTRAEELVAKDQGNKLLSKLLSPQTKADWPGEQAASYDKMVQALLDAQGKQWGDRLKAVVNEKDGAGRRFGRRNMQARLQQPIKDIITERHQSELSQRQADKRSHIRRKGAALLMGGAAGISGALHATDSFNLFKGGNNIVYGPTGGHVEVPSGGDGGGGAWFDKYPPEAQGASPEATVAPVNQVNQAGPTAPDTQPEVRGDRWSSNVQEKHSRELHRYGGELSGDGTGQPELYTESGVIRDRFSDSETVTEAAAKHLNNVAEYQALDAHSQELVRNELASKMELGQDEQGSYWRIEKVDMAEAIRHAEDQANSTTGELAGPGLSDMGVETDTTTGPGLSDMEHAGGELHTASGETIDGTEIMLEPIAGNETVAQAAAKQLNRIQEFRAITNDLVRQRIIDRAAVGAEVRLGDHGPSWVFRKNNLRQAIYNNS